MFPLIVTLYIRNSPRNSLDITIASPDSDLLIEMNLEYSFSELLLTNKIYKSKKKKCKKKKCSNWKGGKCNCL